MCAVRFKQAASIIIMGKFEIIRPKNPAVASSGLQINWRDNKEEEEEEARDNKIASGSCFSG